MEENSCRVCMKFQEDMSSIFEEPERLYDKLQYCTGLLITKEDGLPSKICDRCLKDLKTAFKFKTTCLQAEETFKLKKKYLIKTEIEEKSYEVNFFLQEDCTEESFENSFEKGTDNGKIEIKLEIGNALEKGDLKIETSKMKSITKKCVAKYPKKDKTVRTENKLGLKPKPSLSIPYKVDCNLCNKTFRTNSLYDKHKRRVHEKKPFTCEICGKVFSNKTTRSVHKLTHQEPKFHCDHCHFRTFYRSNLVNHMPLHTGVKKYTCTQCPLTFGTYSKRLAHTRRVHSTLAMYKCNVCAQEFVKSFELGRHLDKHHGVKRHVCEVCKGTFTRRSDLNRHLFKQHNVQMPAASRRRRQCASELSINLQSNNQCQPEPAQNTLTSQAHTVLTSQAQTPITIKNEKAITVNDIQDLKVKPRERVRRCKLVCDLCNITFQTKALYAAHNRKVHEKKSFVCEICGKVFRHQSAHSAHKLIHKAPRHHCNNCDYKTCNKQDLVKHMRVHAGIRKYACPQCPSTFSTSSNRLAHIRRAHVKLPRFTCHVCGRGFVEKYELGRHLDMHQGVKRYECELCQTKFTLKKHLKRHLLKQHDVQMPPARGRRRQYASEQTINLQSINQGQSTNNDSSRTTQEQPLSTHSDLTSQAQTVLTPQAQTVLPPQAQTVLTSQTQTVLTPQAQTVLMPQAQTVLPPQAPTVLKSQAHTVIMSHAFT